MPWTKLFWTAIYLDHLSEGTRGPDGVKPAQPRKPSAKLWGVFAFIILMQLLAILIARVT